MRREEKEKFVQDLSDTLGKIDNFYLVDFKGITVSQSTELRKLMRENSYSFQVVKNRLALRVVKHNYPESLSQCFEGPTALAFAPQDPVGLARLLKDFSEQNNVLAVKGGILEGQFMAPEKFNEIARLTSREDLLSKMAYLMTFPMLRLVRTWQAPLLSLGSVWSQLKEKK
ncbi:MAG: 50S ribosomal protein L10 [Candidatus Aminicenantes bacterium]|nr:50S ribosomal protein L10 [Candidatus Aminicenantes bacterium]